LATIIVGIRSGNQSLAGTDADVSSTLTLDLRKTVLMVDPIEIVVHRDVGADLPVSLRRALLQQPAGQRRRHRMMLNGTVYSCSGTATSNDQPIREHAKPPPIERGCLLLLRDRLWGQVEMCRKQITLVA
jgi:hypothetical protein